MRSLSVCLQDVFLSSSKVVVLPWSDLSQLNIQLTPLFNCSLSCWKCYSLSDRYRYGSVLVRNIQTLATNMKDDVNGKNWTVADFDHALGVATCGGKCTSIVKPSSEKELLHRHHRLAHLPSQRSTCHGPWWWSWISRRGLCLKKGLCLFVLHCQFVSSDHCQFVSSDPIVSLVSQLHLSISTKWRLIWLDNVDVGKPLQSRPHVQKTPWSKKENHDLDPMSKNKTYHLDPMSQKNLRSRPDVQQKTLR